MRESTFTVVFLIVIVCGGAVFAIKSQTAVTYKNPHIYKTVQEESGQYLNPNTKPYSVFADPDQPFGIKNGSVPCRINQDYYWAFVKEDGTLEKAQKIDNIPRSMTVASSIQRSLDAQSIAPKRIFEQIFKPKKNWITITYNGVWRAPMLATWNGGKTAPSIHSQSAYVIYPDAYKRYKLEYIEFDVFRGGKNIGKKHVAIELESAAAGAGHFISLDQFPPDNSSIRLQRKKKSRFAALSPVQYKNAHVYKVVKEGFGEHLKAGEKPYELNPELSASGIVSSGGGQVNVTYDVYWAKVRSDGTLDVAEKAEIMPAALANNELISRLINAIPPKWSQQAAFFGGSWESPYSTWDGKNKRPSDELVTKLKYQMTPDLHIDFELRYIELDVYKWGKFAGKERIAIEMMSNAEYFGHFTKVESSFPNSARTNAGTTP